MKSLLISIILFLVTNMTAQNLTVDIGSAENVVPGDSVTIPVNVSNFNGVGVITIKINYDVNQISGGRLINLNPAIADNSFYSVVDGEISLSYLNFIPINLGEDKLFDIKVEFIGTPNQGTSELEFDPSSEIADDFGTPLATDFLDGYINPYPILVTFPNGGEIFEVNSNQNITWEQFGLSNITIEYSNDAGNEWNFITTADAVSGSYNWTVPNDITTQALIRIYDSSNNTFLDESDNMFIISEQKIITVSQPNGGENILQDSVFPIEWQSGGVLNIDLEYRDSEAGSWIEIVSNIDASLGTYDWSVPNIITNEARIRISDSDDETVEDISDNVFSISAPSLTVIQPNGGELIEIGSNYDIQWTYFGVENVNIEYRNSNSGAWNLIVSNVDATLGSYNWTVPNDPTNEASVRITDAVNSSILDISDNVFSIGTLFRTLTISDIQATPGSNVIVPINVTDFTSIGSVTLQIDFNNEYIEFVQAIDINPEISSALINTNQNGNSVLVSWIDGFPFTGANIENGKLMDLEFKFLGGGSSNITVNEAQSEIADINGIPLQINYDNGSVSSNVSEYFVLNSPADGASLAGGENYDITWNSEGVVNLEIQFSINNGQSFNLVADNLSASDKVYTWTVPQITTDQAVIKLVSKENSSVSAQNISPFSITAEPFIEVTSPNGGENFTGGELTNITWNREGVSNVNIDLYNNDVFFENIASGVNASLGTYSWQVPSEDLNSAKIRISETGNSSFFDESDNTFTIVPSGELEIILPDLIATPGNEIIVPVSGKNLINVGAITLFVLYNQDVLEYSGIQNIHPELEGLLANVGTGNNIAISWFDNLPPFNGANISDDVLFELKFDYLGFSTDLSFDQVTSEISDTDGNTLNPLYTNGSIASSLTNYVNLISPNGGEDFIAGSTQKIKFTAEGSNVNIYYRENDLAGWTLIQGNITPTLGEIDWLIPSLLTSEAKVKAELSDNNTIFDESEGYFSISINENIELTSPNGGESLNAFDNFDITWNSDGVSNINLSYSTDDFVTENEIISNIQASVGVYSWSIPNIQSGNVKVRIESSENNTIFDESDNFFTINQAGSLSFEIGNELAVPQEEVLVPIQAVNMYQVGAITFNIPFDSNLLEFIGLENINAEISDLLFNINQGNNAILVSWIDNEPPFSGANIGDGKLFDMKFMYKGGNASITIDETNSEIADIDGNPIPFTFTEGSVISSVAEYVTIISPNGGESFNSGITEKIEFVSAGGNIDLYYRLNDLSSWILIESNVSPASGEYDWLIPSFSTNQAKVKAELSDNISVNDESDDYFSISITKVIQVTAPNGGENLNAFENFDITWQSQGINNVNIYYSTDDFVTENTIAEGIQASVGTYQWLVPNDVTTNAKIKVMSEIEPNVFDISDASFNILAPGQMTLSIESAVALPQSEAFVTVSVENFYNVGAITLEIPFENNLLDFVGLENINSSISDLLVNTNAEQNRILISWIDNEPPFSGANIGNGNLFDIKFNYTASSPNVTIDETNSEIADVNGTPINVIYTNGGVSPSVSEYVVITSPNGGELLNGNDIETVSWISEGIQLLKMEFSSNNGNEWQTIAENIDANNLMYEWRVNNVATNDALVRLSWMDNSSVNDVNDSVFAITFDSAPFFTATLNDSTITELDSISFQYAGEDPEGNEIAFSLVSTPVGNMSITSDGLFKWNTSLSDSGIYNIVIGLTDIIERSIVYDTAIVKVVDKSVNVIAPNGGESLIPGDVYIIEWLTSGVDSVILEYSVDNGSNWVEIEQTIPEIVNKSQKKSNQKRILADEAPIYSKVNSSNSLIQSEWVIPFIPTNSGLIRVTDAGNSLISDESDALFTIETPSSIGLSISSIAASPNQTITLPVSATDFKNVLSGVIKIDFNGSVLESAQIINPNPSLPSLTVSTNSNFIQIEFETTSPISEIDTVLFDLRFNYLAGQSSIAFDETITKLVGPDMFEFNISVQNGTVTQGAPTAPILLYPENNSLNIKTNPTLVWASVPTAVSYHYQVAYDSLFQNLFTGSSGLIDTIRTIEGLENDSTFYWRVRAKNATVYGSWSNVNKFKTHKAVETVSLVSPEVELIILGDSVEVVTSIQVNGETTGSGQAEGVTAWIGYNDSDTDPENWTDWKLINYSGDLIDKDVYSGYLGAELNHGKHYIAARFKYYDSEYYYGGFSEVGGGFWNGSENVSGIIYVIYESINAPTNLTAAAEEVGKVTLAWEDNSNNEDGFRIERQKQSAGNYIIIDSAEANAITFIDSTVTDLTTYRYRILAFNSDTLSVYSNIAEVTTLTSLRMEYAGIPENYEVFQNYPNPFNPSTVIRYGLPEISNVKLMIYNILGEEVVGLLNEVQDAGYYEISWDAGNLTSGMYIYIIDAKSLSQDKSFREIRKMLLVK